MGCRVSDLRHKEVINAKDGCRLGFVDDVEIDIKTSQVNSLIIYGKWRCFGLFGRYDDIFLSWSSIELIGEDAIIVNYNIPERKTKGIKDFFFKK